MGNIVPVVVRSIVLPLSGFDTLPIATGISPFVNALAISGSIIHESPAALLMVAATSARRVA
jgi:hypothetical protein